MDISVRDGKQYRFGAFLLNPSGRSLSCDGQPVALSATLFDTLVYLAEHSGRVVSKEELLDTIWSHKVVEEANVSQTIFSLRKALAKAGGYETVIATAPGRGYRFVLPVQIQSLTDSPETPIGVELDGPTPAPHLAAFEEPTPKVARRLQRSRFAQLGAVVIIGILAVGAAVALWAPHRPAKRVKVVLADFQNLSNDPLFDRSLNMAIRINLQQSPVVSVLTDERVSETLIQMNRPKDGPLNAALAHEVCARNNGQAAVEGSIAQIGARYLLSLTAIGCADGQVLAAEKAEVTTRDVLLAALDTLVDRIRRKLGESRASVERFQIPLLGRKTASLEALKAYSQAHYIFNKGRRIEAVALFQKAIDLDPHFPMAYADLAVAYWDLREQKQAIDAITHAYGLRDAAGEIDRQFITLRYNDFVTRDQLADLRALSALTALDPNDGGAWADLSDEDNWIAQYQAAVAAGRRALALEPAIEPAYVVLARALMHSGQLAQARAICDQAIAHHVDGDDLHSLLYQIDYGRGDNAAVAADFAWAKGKPAERTLTIDALQAALAEGRVRHALDLTARIRELSQATGLSNWLLAPNARQLTDLGLADLARANLSQLPADFDSADYRFTTAEIGDPARAQAILAADLAKAPNDTLLNALSAPEVRAALALRRGQTQAALAALKPAALYEMKTFDIPYERGLVYLAAGDGAEATVEFQKILTHRGVEPLSLHYPLAQLGLARAYRLQHDSARSRPAYEAFFTAWKDADPDVSILRAARAEYARL